MCLEVLVVYILVNGYTACGGIMPRISRFSSLSSHSSSTAAPSDQSNRPEKSRMPEDAHVLHNFAQSTTAVRARDASHGHVPIVRDARDLQDGPAPVECGQRCALVAELRGIVTSILTGRISPVTLTVLSLRYADVKGCAIPFRRLGCGSLVELFQQYFADEMACNYMHYYNDYVVWMKDDQISRDTVIARLRRYAHVQRHPTASTRYVLQRTPSIRKTLFKKSFTVNRFRVSFHVTTSVPPG
ncbi:hypothetical protein BIW11_10078 [Tropilaelaps mercedesae]|uniref:Uncharacterized protein n=1 Tax=Tropilaelaps mercedesae TaxID=418985 RepID=A0A1V9XHD6_9ACAR|nr:hypothetical protein BIW11_10078 [Tropilaelaps mercedesae]